MVAPMIYFVGIFFFAKMIFKKEYRVTNSMFFPQKQIHQKTKRNYQKLLQLFTV
jgi:hypothetical protein